MPYTLVTQLTLKGTEIKIPAFWLIPLVCYIFLAVVNSLFIRKRKVKEKEET